MKLYLAGPMTGFDDFNKPAFHLEAKRLRDLGYEVVNPAEINEGFDGEWNLCMKRDVEKLVWCDGIALMPGWDRSRGASIECKLAVDLGLQVFHCATLREVAA